MEGDNINTNTSEIDTALYGFIEDVFIGIETKVYSTLKEKENFNTQIISNEGMLLGINLLEYYLNQVYKSLVDKDDDLITSKFKIYSDLINNTPVYTLNLFTNIIMKSYPKLPRSKLNIENETKYIESVKETAEIMKKYMLHTFHQDLDKLNELKKTEKNEEINNNN